MLDSPTQDTPSEQPPPTPARRRFLRWLSGLGAALSAGLVGYPAFRAFFWPVRPPTSTDHWVKVVEDVALVDIGSPMRVDFVEMSSDAWVETRVLNSVWVFTEDGEHFKAYNGHCTHLGCGYMYDKEKKLFICPCHRGVFDVKTGAVLSGPPPRPLDELKLEVRDGEIHVNYENFRLGVPERVRA